MKRSLVQEEPLLLILPVEIWHLIVLTSFDYQLHDIDQWRSLMQLRRVSHQWASMINENFLSGNLSLLNLLDPDVHEKCPFWREPGKKIQFPGLKTLAISDKHPLIHSVPTMPILNSLWIDGWIKELENMHVSLKHLTVCNTRDDNGSEELFIKPPKQLDSLSLIDTFTDIYQLQLYNKLDYLKLTGGVDWINSDNGVFWRENLKKLLNLEKISMHAYCGSNNLKGLSKFLNSHR